MLVEVLNVKNQGLVSMCCLLLDRQTIIPSPPGTLDLQVHFEIQWVPLTTSNTEEKKTILYAVLVNIYVSDRNILHRKKTC